MKNLFLFFVGVLLSITIFTGCSAKEGDLKFVVNGEDFVREGFVSKDGWELNFEHVYVTLSDITAYQTDPPYDPNSNKKIEGKKEVKLEGVHTIDLVKGSEPILLDTINVPVGFYNALSWKVVKGDSGEVKDKSFVIIGTAQKEGKTIDFTLNFDQELEYFAGEYIGDVRKGIVEEGKSSELEMTFHFDHLFGDIDTDIEDELNKGALGFEPFLEFEQDGEINVDSNLLKENFSVEDYNKLNEILIGLGHVGEGHSYGTLLN